MNNNYLELCQEDYRDKLREILESKAISRNSLASLLEVTPSFLHQLLVYKSCHITLNQLLAITHHLNVDIRFSSGQLILEDTYKPIDNILTDFSITKYNTNILERRFFANNESVLMDNEEQIEYELQEYIIELDLKRAIQLLTTGEKQQIKEMCAKFNGTLHNKSLQEKVKYLHSQGFIILPGKRLLELSVKITIKLHIGYNVSELKRTRFPGIYNWDLIQYENVPF